MRHPNSTAAVTLALTLFAACSEPTAVTRSPSGAVAPSFAKGATTIAPPPYSPVLISGNVSGSAATVCGTVNAMSLGTKVDGPYSQQIGGYAFTVSGADRQYLSFAAIGGAPSTSVLTVFVKGGPDTYRYTFPAGTTTASGLRAPLNGGGNVPTISHYVVCYQPVPPTPGEAYLKICKRPDAAISDVPAYFGNEKFTFVLASAADVAHPIGTYVLGVNQCTDPIPVAAGTYRVAEKFQYVTGTTSGNTWIVTGITTDPADALKSTFLPQAGAGLDATADVATAGGRTTTVSFFNIDP